MPVVVEPSAAVKWLEWLFAWAEGEIEFRALGKSGPRLLATRDPDELGHWLVRNQDRDIYHGAASRAPGSAPPGRLETVWRVPALWADLDRVEDKAAVLELARGCYCPPSSINDSGGGLHLWWRLPEAEPPDEALVALLRGLARVFGGDPAVCDLARIMRLPGTLNHKYDPPRPCAVLWQSDVTYQLPDLQEWLSWQRELRGEPVDPWLAAAARVGVRVPLDVEEALAGMEPGNVHDRQLRVSASLAAHGVPEEEIVTRLMTATRLAAGEEGRRWDWRKEEAGIRRMIGGAQQKFAQVINLQQEREERAALAPKGKGAILEKVAKVALERWGRPLITVEGELWTYEGGVWRYLDDGGLHDLRTHVMGAARLLKVVEDKTLNGAFRWIKEDPGLIRRGVVWDAAGVIVGSNGALDLATGQIVPHSPEHYATRSVACALDREAQCPRWLQFLREALPQDTDACIATLQEWMGAALIRGKPRELRKGLIVYGPSYTGKTQIAKVVRALLGSQTCGLRVRLMSERFGMQPLIHASGWVADDAVGQHEVMDAEAYKLVVTGESVSVERKNKGSVEIAFDLPVLLTMNNFPVVKDSSDAVYNRTLVLLMRVVRSEKDAVPIADLVTAEELSGVLNWAVAGLQRLLARGWFEPPEAMIASLKEFKGSNNAFGEFWELCIEENADRMVYREDFRKAFNAWLKTEIQARAEWSGKAIAQAMKNSHPDVIAERDTQGNGRVWIGIEFKNDALQYLNDFMETKRVLADVNHGIPLKLRERIPKKTSRTVF
jgi:P4 family phage/plasmid primase-like protien